jgi:cytosine deaminase
MSLDFVLRQARIAGREAVLVDIGVRDGRIAEIAANILTDAPTMPLDGRLVLPGFVDTHIHLDKSCIVDRCKCEEGTSWCSTARAAPPPSRSLPSRFSA